MKNINVLNINLGGTEIGRLALGKDGLCRFEYSANWLKDGFSISPFFLPLKPGLFTAKPQPFNGLFGVFADSLPDGWGNLLLDRFLQSKGIRLSAVTVLDRLAFVGGNGMGALTYEPDKSLMFKEDAQDLSRLSVEVAEILAERADIPTVTKVLEHTGSSGGARPKVLIKHNNASWMVKFASSHDPTDIGQKEYFYAQLAGQCGIDMPETKLFENRFFGTKLFDRLGEQRYHMHSASGLLHASHRYPSLDYLQLAKATLLLTRNMKEVGKLLRVMTFNVLIENMDDHAKNFSYIYKDNHWALSPAYDLVKGYGFGNEHATAACGAGRPLRKDLEKVAKEVEFPAKEMKQIIEQVFDTCLSSEIGTELQKRKF